MGRIKCYLERDDGRALFKGGTFIPCGSIAERTKVGEIDEFYFQYLIKLDDYSPTRKRLPQTKARKGSTSFGRKCLFHIKGASGVKLKAGNIQKQFMTDVRQAVGVLLGIKSENKIETVGPAVKLVVAHPDLEYKVKIDLTVGIRAKPHDLFMRSDLTPLGVKLLDNLELKCHFVPSNEFWKVCFVESELELMRRICDGGIPQTNVIGSILSMYSPSHNEVKTTCYRIIKCLRDEFVVKDENGDSILQSYPLKVTFMDLALNDDEAQDGQWNTRNIGRNVIRILDEVKSRGSRNNICNLFVREDDVMGESDRSYVECSSILKELKKKHNTFLEEKYSFHAIFTILMGVIAFIDHMFRHGQRPNPLPDFGYNVSDVCNASSITYRNTDVPYLWAKASSDTGIILNVIQGFINICFMVSIFTEILNLYSKNTWKVWSKRFPVLLTGSLFIVSLVYLNKIRDSENIDDILSRRFLCSCQLLTIFPVLDIQLRIQLNILVSFLHKKDVIPLLDSIFDIPIDRYKPLYVADTTFIRLKPWSHWLALVMLLAIPMFSTSMMLFMYAYAWIENHDFRGIDVDEKLVLLALIGLVGLHVLILSYYSEWSWRNMAPTIAFFILVIVFLLILLYFLLNVESCSIFLFKLFTLACFILKIHGIFIERFIVFQNDMSRPLLFNISAIPSCIAHIFQMGTVGTLAMIINIIVCVFLVVIVRSALYLKSSSINLLPLFPLMTLVVLILLFTHVFIAVYVSLASKSYRQYLYKVYLANGKVESIYRYLKNLNTYCKSIINTLSGSILCHYHIGLPLMH